MKKHQLFLSVLSLFLLVPASITWAQTTTSQYGLKTIELKLPAGIIRIYLPDDIRAGDMISGTVQFEPAGNSEKQRKNALDQLLKRKLKIADPADPAQAAVALQSRYVAENRASLIQFEVNGLPFTSSLSVMNNGQAEYSIPIEIRENQVNNTGSSISCTWPTHALAGSPIRINGSFDGNSDNTVCRIGGAESAVLAESPRNCFVRMPESASKKQILQVNENNREPCTGQISTVNLQLSAGKLNLLKGEKTYVDISVSGLDQLPGNAGLTVENRSAGVVNMSPANTIVADIDPDSVTDGLYQRRYFIQSLKSGNFSISANLELPDKAPLIFADVHIQEVKGLKNGMADAFEKVVIEATGSQASSHPELDECRTCLSCIQARLNEDKVALVGWLGETLIEHFAGKALDAVGGVAKWLKDRYENIKNAKDAAEALNNAMKSNEIQVVELEGKQCEKNGSCLVKGIAFYDTKTSCIDVFMQCQASKACCKFAITTVHFKYCVGSRGYILPGQTPAWEVTVE